MQHTLFPPTPGIYALINCVTHYTYVGSTIDLRRRCYEHFSRLEKSCHCNSHLQRSYDLYGPKVFIFHVLEHTQSDEAVLLSHEQHYIDFLKPEYNLAPEAGRIMPAGTKRDPESAKKTGDTLRAMYASGELVNFRKGKPIHPNASAALVKRNKEMLKQPEYVSRRIESFKANRAAKILVNPDAAKQSPKHIANRAAARRGWKPSPETIAKREATKCAKREAGEYTSTKGHKLSPETIAKRSATLKANNEQKRLTNPDALKRSPEQMANLTEAARIANTGRRKPPEDIEKMKATKQMKKEAGLYAPRVVSAESLAKRQTTHRAKVEAGLYTPPNLGRKRSAESRAKHSATLRAKVESGEYISPTKGTKHTPEHRAKIGASSRGRKQSPETIAKRLETRRLKREQNPTYGVASETIAKREAIRRANRLAKQQDQQEKLF